MVMDNISSALVAAHDSVSFYKSLKAGQGLLPLISSIAAQRSAARPLKTITIADGENHIALDGHCNIIVPTNTQADIFITHPNFVSTAMVCIALKLEEKSVANVFWQDDARAVASQVGVIDFSCQLAKDSQLNSFSFLNLHNTMRCQQTIALQGAGASVAIFVGGKSVEKKSAAESQGKKFADSTIHIIHHANNSQSLVAVRGVVDDSEVMIGQVRTDIVPHATGADTTQDIKAMILSPDAKFFGKPELNIKHDRVKAKHGLSVGAINDEQIFYLRSRGIDHNTARQLLLSSFFIGGLHLFSGALLKKADAWLQPFLNQPV